MNQIKMRVLVSICLAAGLGSLSCGKERHPNPPARADSSIDRASSWTHQLDDSTVAIMQVRTLVWLIFEYDSAYGHLPANLAEVTRASIKWNGPRYPQDIWGELMEFERSGDHFTVGSQGADGIVGTKDDILFQGDTKVGINGVTRVDIAP